IFMSGINDSYDPKEVAALSTDELAGAQAAALQAFAEAADLDQLAAAHAAHLGSKSPVALARRELGALPPQARADAGRRVYETLTTITARYDDARLALEVRRDERVLVE